MTAGTASTIGAPAAALRGGRADARAVGWWLVAVAAMVFVMVAIGGMTRLTESGLSITEWQPIAGTLPPLSDADWQALFAKYKQSPQFQKTFPDLTLAGFKEIFWLEYIHRLWGRLIGVVFLVPLLWFWMRGRVPKGYGPALVGLFVLGGLQGAVGWLMVASGLVDRPAVSHYRLAIHLGLAIVIYAALLWTALGLFQPRGASALARRDRGWVHLAYTLIALTILAGALVAGLRAGLIYNGFPLMGGALVPSDYWVPELGWLNAFENRAAVQFHHRVLATLTLLAAAYLWWRVRGAASWVLAAVLLQYALGVATILMFGQTPPPMGAAVAIGTLHQAGAMVLVTAAVWFAHAARRVTASA
ncbi:MAG: COX15/CtaA family protein [Candidatus Odyssella sp.]|nr:COX15/CtaA family protein [Candidatus Odyssella sp.]